MLTFDFVTDQRVSEDMPVVMSEEFGYGVAFKSKMVYVPPPPLSITFHEIFFNLISRHNLFQGDVNNRNNDIHIQVLHSFLDTTHIKSQHFIVRDLHDMKMIWIYFVLIYVIFVFL